MSRLTKRDKYGDAGIIGVDSEDIKPNLHCHEFDLFASALNKLADYEDAEENKMPILLIRDMVYYVDGIMKKIISYTIDRIEIELRCDVVANYHGTHDFYDGGFLFEIQFDGKSIGKNIFLTKQEAEEKLKLLK